MDVIIHHLTATERVHVTSWESSPSSPPGLALSGPLLLLWRKRMGVQPALHDREGGRAREREREEGRVRGSWVFTCKLHLLFPDSE